MQVGNLLYSCTPENVISAIDGETGKAVWKFDPHSRSPEHITCRGVGYHDIDKDESLPSEEKAAFAGNVCRQRIFTSTVDAKLIALDAHDGTVCPGFGENGFVDLTKRMGPTENSKRYHPTATPVVAGHLVIVGGWVRDIMEGEPSGVVRAFDARTGALVWAWDVGNPDNASPQSTLDFTPGTPNVWTIPTYDKDLKLVYLSTGNGPPDYWGGDRSEEKEKFGSSVVAVDVTNGHTKWVYQIVHHDVWDYDLPSHPVLYDVTNAQGQKIPALIQTTKMGQFFVLDRRTGEPVTPVEERPVAQGAANGDHLSPTQPYSAGMPVLGGYPLTESSMWGMTTFDQLYCRILFKDSVYVGPYTPPSEKFVIEWPSILGGMNWGGVTIDERTDMLYVNDVRIPLRFRLVTAEEAKKYKVTTDEVPGYLGVIRPQVAGSYGGIEANLLQSFLDVPCNTPPFGTMSAVDLKTKTLEWQVPLGTVEDTGPMKIKTHLSLPIGMPTIGGPTSTASGLVFFAGTQDYYLRALDSATGKEVWKARMPVGSTASPMIYQSTKTGKEYVVISAGGASGSPDKGDYIIAYALPGGVVK